MFIGGDEDEDEGPAWGGEWLCRPSVADAGAPGMAKVVIVVVANPGRGWRWRSEEGGEVSPKRTMKSFGDGADVGVRAFLGRLKCNGQPVGTGRGTRLGVEPVAQPKIWKREQGAKAGFINAIDPGPNLCAPFPSTRTA